MENNEDFKQAKALSKSGLKMAANFEDELMLRIVALAAAKRRARYIKLSFIWYILFLVSGIFINFKLTSESFGTLKVSHNTLVLLFQMSFLTAIIIAADYYIKQYKSNVFKY